MKKYNLQKQFQDLQFDEPTHTYTVKGKKLKSVTTIIKDNFTRPFESFFISRAVSEKYAKDGIDVDQKVVETYWNYISDFAKAYGTLIHYYAEQMPNFMPPKYKAEESVIKFYDEIIKDKEQIVAKELRCYFKNTAGTVDLITADENGLIIRDYKTSKDILKSYGKLRWYFKEFDDCQLNAYTIQLLIYKYLIEEATGIRAYKLEIVKLSDDGYEIHPINRNIAELFNYLIVFDDEFYEIINNL